MTGARGGADQAVLAARQRVAGVNCRAEAKQAAENGTKRQLQLQRRQVKDTAGAPNHIATSCLQRSPGCVELDLRSKQKERRR